MECLDVYPDVSTTFLYMTENPYDEVNLTSKYIFPPWEFTVFLYDKNSVRGLVNEARTKFVLKKNNSLETCCWLR